MTKDLSYIFKKITQNLDFKPKFSIEIAIEDLKKAFEKKLILDSFNDPRYFNIKMMQKLSYNEYFKPKISRKFI